MAALCLLTMLAAMAQSAFAQPDTELPEPIKTISGFWRVPSHHRGTAQSIDLELTILYYDPVWKLLWASSHGASGFIPCADTSLPLKPRQRVRLKGAVIPELGLSGRQLTVTILEDEVELSPMEASHIISDTAALRDRLITCEGTVQKQFQQGRDHMTWVVFVKGRKLNARTVIEQGKEIPQLEGKEVRVTGVYSIPQGGSDDIDLWMPSMASIVPVGLGGDVDHSEQKNARIGGTSTRMVQTLTEYWDTPPENRGQPVPAALDLTIYYYDPSWGLLWADSNGKPGFIECYETPLPIKNGQRVLITGTVVPGKGIPGSQVKVTVLEESTNVRAHPISGLIGDGRRFNHRMVTVEGIVDRASEADAQHPVWDLISEGHAVTARMHLTNRSDAPRLEGKTVRMRGVYSPKVDPAGDVFGIDLWIPSLDDIEILGSLSEDKRFAIPATPIQRMSTRSGMIRVVGTLREYEPGRRASIRDITGTVELNSLQAQPMRIGDRVEAIGYPSVSGLRRILSSAIMRPFKADDEESLRLTGTAVELQGADRVLELSPEAAATGRPVQVSGLVTWSHPLANFLYLEDNSGGVCVRFDSSLGKPPSPGNAVTVSGVTASGRYAPYIAKPVFEQRGAMILPQASLVTLEQAITGNLEGRWIEMRGYVSSVERDGLWCRIILTGPTGQFTALLPGDAVIPPIIGSVIRVRGVCEAVANDRRQLVGIQIWIIEPSYIRVEAAAPEDPFSVPRQSVASLRQFSTVPALNRWVRIQATVLHHAAGDRIFVEEEGEGLVVVSRGSQRLSPGDTIEAVGLPGLEGRRAVLREAVYRKSVVANVAPTPMPVERINPYWEELDSRLVSIRGTLVSVLHQPNEILFALQNNGAVFNAVLTARIDSDLPEHWIPGTEIAATGVYRIDYDERSEPQSVRLQLRTISDVTIVKSAPWWTLGRTLAVVSILTGSVVLGLLWALSLRRRVRQQTDLIRAQLAKEANLEARNRSIVENASDFIFTADLNGRITAFNPAGERITGYDQTEALAMNIRDLIASETDTAHAKDTMRSELGGGATFQTRLRTKDGTGIWVEISSRFIAEAGKPVGVLGIVRDISERKQFEDRLEAARDAAEASARAKSAFLANMSHEIRTPMNGVIGVANLLLDTTLTHEQRDFAETIRTSAESLLTVLNDILDFSKIEAGKLEFESVPFDLAETVESAVDLLAARAAAKNLELTAHIASDVPNQLVGDPGRLRQVLLNLLSNAIKFTERGEVVVRVSVLAKTEEQTSLRFEVVDTGIGLTPEESGRLFQPFSQADSSTTRKFGGTGLGLAICKQIAELMHGEIGVNSVKGSGSTFWVTAQFGPVCDGTVQHSLAVPELAGRNVMVVDHTATSTQALCEYLTAAGMRCEVLSDSNQALDRIATQNAGAEPFHFVILNSALAEEDALIWPHRIAEKNFATKPWTILLLPIDRRHTTEELRDANADLIVAKPIRRFELLNGMQRLVSGVRSETPAPNQQATALAGPGESEALGRALVVEDNMVNQRVARVTLERIGFRVELAANGLEALEALERTQYDFILMDCQMPEMDGYEATRRIRSGRHADVRIIAMTANAMEGDRERCLAAGMDDYVSKPMRVPELRAALARCQLLQHGESVGA